MEPQGLKLEFSLGDFPARLKAMPFKDPRSYSTNLRDAKLAISDWGSQSISNRGMALYAAEKKLKLVVF